MQSLAAVEDGSFCVKTLALLAASQHSLSKMNASVQGCKPSYAGRMGCLIDACKIFVNLQSSWKSLTGKMKTFCDRRINGFHLIA